MVETAIALSLRDLAVCGEAEATPFPRQTGLEGGSKKDGHDRWHGSHIDAVM